MAAPFTDRFRFQVSTFAALAIVAAAVIKFDGFGRASVAKQADRGEIQNPNTIRIPTPPITPAAPERSPSIEVAGGTSDPEELAGRLRATAVNDPQAALAAVPEHEDVELRLALFQTILEAWAATDLEAATRWAATQPWLDSGRAFAAVLRGATQPPAELIACTLRLASDCPTHRPVLTRQLLHALGERGQHELAAAIADATPAGHRTDSYAAVYSNWARKDPESAVLSSLRLTDAGSRHIATSTAISTWAETNPAGLVAAAMNFPKGPVKEFALVAGLRGWIAQDPQHARSWVLRHGSLVNGIERVLED